ncbi:MAG: hypothetical protein AAF404_17520, partial [Pseudomonadota bacterium]
GVGSTEGAPIQEKNGGFVKDANDNIVIAKLAVERLQELAKVGGGRYTTTQRSDNDIKQLLAVDRSLLVKGDSNAERQADIWLERGPYLVLLMLPVVALFFRRGVL